VSELSRCIAASELLGAKLAEEASAAETPSQSRQRLAFHLAGWQPGRHAVQSAEAGKQAGRLAALRTHITALKGSHSHCKAAQKEAQLKVFQMAQEHEGLHESVGRMRQENAFTMQRLSAAVDVRRDTRLALTTAADAEREILHRELAAAHKELDAQRTNLMAARWAAARSSTSRSGRGSCC